MPKNDNPKIRMGEVSLLLLEPTRAANPLAASFVSPSTKLPASGSPFADGIRFTDLRAKEKLLTVYIIVF